VTVNTVQGIAPQASLSEVRFYYIPTYATGPNPAPDALNVAPDTSLSWDRDGREADRHEVYVGTNANDLALAGAVGESSFSLDALDLQLGTAYAWRVDEHALANELPRLADSSTSTRCRVVDETFTAAAKTHDNPAS
jgi:hypothetical protein